MKKTGLRERQAGLAHLYEQQAGGQQKKGMSLWTDERVLR